jgi:hypothetical protein
VHYPEGSDSVVNTVDVLCNDLNQLTIQDTALTTDIAIKILALSPQQGSIRLWNSRTSNNDDSKIQNSLPNLTAILALLESLRGWTVYITNGSESVARAVVSLTYGRLLEQFLTCSDETWEYVRRFAAASKKTRLHRDLLGYHSHIKRLLGLDLGVKLDRLWNSVKAHLNDRLSTVENHLDKITKKKWRTQRMSSVDKNGKADTRDILPETK